MQFAGAKRPRLEKVPAAEVIAMPTDIPHVAACFNVTQFNSKAWIASLDPATCEQYQKSLEGERNSDRQHAGTIDFITEYRALKDHVTRFL